MPSAISAPPPRRVVVALFRALLREARLLARAPRARLRLFAPLHAAEAARLFGSAGRARDAEPAEALQRRVFAGHALVPLLLRELGLAGSAALSGAEVAAAVRRGVRMQPPAPGGLDAGLGALQALARLRADAATSTASEATHARGTAVSVELTTTPLSSSDLGAGAAAEGAAPRHFPFAYRVTVTNTGNKTLQLLARHWHFADAEGGAIVVPKWSTGVVGEQPILQPLQSFSYVSGVELRTPTGTMSGALRFLVPSESEFVEASVAETALKARGGGAAGGPPPHLR